MSLDEAGLDSFGQLAEAIGLFARTSTDASVKPNAAWFSDPIGSPTGGSSNTGGNRHGLRHLLADDHQRRALLGFVDGVLGPPDRAERDGYTWVPLFRQPTANVTVSVVVGEEAGEVHLGVGVEHTTPGGPPRVSSRLHVPIFRFARGGATLSGNGSLPGWLHLGRPGARVTIGVDATFTDAPPPPGEASLGGVALTLGVPTSTGDDLGIALKLRDLQLPGATAPRTFSLDSDGVEELGRDVYELLIGLIRAQANALDLNQPLTRSFAAVAGLLGLRDVALPDTAPEVKTEIPALPLADIPTQGLAPIVGWAETVLNTERAKDAWLGQLALLVGGTANPAHDTVEIELGKMRLALALRVTPGTGGHPVLVPSVELALVPRTGVRARLKADVLRADTGTGACTALPDVRLEAVFGADAHAGAPPLLSPPPGGSPSVTAPRVGSLRTGVALDPSHRPAFALTLHDVSVGGPPHPVLDLSSPGAALESAGTVVEDAVADAIGRLGPVGALVNRLLGLEAPAGVTRLEVTGLLADPLGELRRYWRDLTASPTAGADVLGRLAALVSGGAVAPAPGAGTADDPWRVGLAGPVDLVVARDGDALVVDVEAAVRTAVMEEYQVAAALGLTLLRAGLGDGGGVTFATEARGRLAFARPDGGPAQLRFGAAMTLEADEVAASVAWAPASGLRAGLTAAGLAVLVPDAYGVRIPFELPTVDAQGHLVMPAADWFALEQVLAAFLSGLGVPAVDALMDLVGWRGVGAHLPLAGLVGADGDPGDAVQAWLADLVLDGDRVRMALAPIAQVLSALRRAYPLGGGTARDPLRCPVGEGPRAPGLAVWLEPDGPPEIWGLADTLGPLRRGYPPELSTVVGVVRDAAAVLPDVAGLLVGRDSLCDGLELLMGRWTGTDGLVGRPGALPAGVAAAVVDGASYDRLVALGDAGYLVGIVADDEPAAVVYVGCEPVWVADRPAGTAFDRSAPNPDGVDTVPATGDGAWFVRLPAPAVAAAARPERGGVGEQAARLAGVLAARTDPIVVVAYGPCGAAAIRAAGGVAAVSQVVTVGTPWAPLSTGGLRTGLAGDALRFLTRLGLADRAADDFDGIVRRCVTMGVADEPPAAHGEPVRPGLAVLAVFGRLDADRLAQGLARHVATGLAAREATSVAAIAPAEVAAVHAGVHLPLFDLDVGGLLVAATATVDLARMLWRDRAGTGSDLDVSPAPAVTVDVALSVRDGWLVGGPGGYAAVGDLRRMSARFVVPMGGGPDGRAGDAELVLHEAQIFGVARERWVVRADATGAVQDVTTALPEVRVLLSDVVARLRAASPDLGALFDVVGLTRAGGPDPGGPGPSGLDPSGLDRLLHDPAVTTRVALAAGHGEAARHLRALIPGAGGAGSALQWTVGPTRVDLDLGAGTLACSARMGGGPGGLGGGTDIVEAGLVPVQVDIALTGAGPSVTVAVGEIDPDAGGLRLLARTAPSAGIVAEWASPRGPVRTVGLLPDPSPAAIADLATVALPALAAHGLVSSLRWLVPSPARPALDAGLAAVGLLTEPDALGGRGVVVPIGLLTDPGGWLRHAVSAWQTNAAASAVALLDALAPLVSPGRGGASGWPIADGVAVRYGVESGNRLRLAIEATLAADVSGTAVTTQIAGGLVIGPNGPPTPTVAASIDVAGRGLSLVVDPAAVAGSAASGAAQRPSHGAVNPAVRLSLVRPGATALPLFPNGPGLGQAVGAAAESLVPVVLNAVVARRAESTLVGHVARAVFNLGDALELLDGDDRFSGAAITDFADDPAAALVDHLPQIVVGAVPSIATALDPTGQFVDVSGPTGNRVTLGFGHGQPVEVTLDASTPGSPAIELRVDAVIARHEPPSSTNRVELARFSLERLRVSTTGVDIAARVGPFVLDVGPFTLRPLLVVRAGSARTSDRLIGIGLALDADADNSVEVRWALGANAPALATVRRGAAIDGELVIDDPADAARSLLALALSVAGGVVVAGLSDVLTPRAVDCLRGVVFAPTATGAEMDLTLADDILNPDKLFGRLKRLLWNAATLAPPPPTPNDPNPAAGLRLTIDNLVTIGLVSHDVDPNDNPDVKALGLSVSLPVGQRLTLADEDTKVELEVDATWVNPTVTPGLAVYVLQGPSSDDLAVVPGVSVAGLGLRFTKKGGPLLSLGPVSLNGIAVHVYGEVHATRTGGAVTAAGAGGGVNLELSGLSFAPGGAGGNAMAGSIVKDAGKAGPASRPAFSPSLAVQKHPGRDVTVSLRAGPPPGPWWIVIQRQLGPIYLERVGFDTKETGGTLSKVSVLLDGQVALFGLAAAVDQLSLSWHGGDFFDVSRWQVDLMGLAVSANMSGVTLAGGILKTVDIDKNDPQHEIISYVGMLLGRFGTYGLSVFGGFSNDRGNASFFIFGGINGPIGGPPYFFIQGVGGGLGINRGLVIPDDPSGFNKFPFIEALDPAAKPAEPMDRLRDLNKYFPVQRGNFWFAAGISFNVFQLIDGIAVVAVSFGDGFELNLLGLARVALPKPQAALVSIELGLLVRFSTRDGVFMMRAGLTENSWLLYQEVHLTGGFAFVIWWKGPLSGQFVVTMGGYHPDFHRDGYPEVAPLGLSWRVSDQIVIKGGTYFAFTSEALMAGLQVEVSADFGFAWARIEFGAHALIYFDPFWYEAVACARIAAGVKLKNFFGTISFSFSFAAEIRVWGPEFTGEAFIELGPTRFSVEFGSKQVVEPAVLVWSEFVAKYLEDTGNGTARALSGITGRGTLPASTNGQRDAPSSDGTEGRPFEVFAEFELTIVSTMPLTGVETDPAAGPVAMPVKRSDGASARLGLKPMAKGPLASTLRVRLDRGDDATGASTTPSYTSAQDKLRALGANLAAATPRPGGSDHGREGFPIGVFGVPDPAGVTAPPMPTGDVIFATSKVRLVAEATPVNRGPVIEYRRFDAARRPLPLRATGPDRALMSSEAATLPAVEASTSEEALAAAEARLFAPTPATVPGGLVATGSRSALARASYRGDVSAPPLFGTLADGLVPTIAAGTTVTRVVPPAAPAVPALRPPVVAGYLTAAEGTPVRSAATTVADGRPPRRAAPTLAAARVRLGADLPVRLDTTAEPSVPRNGTLVGATVPRTVLPGTTRSYAMGRLRGLVGGLDARDVADSATHGPGPAGGVKPRNVVPRRLTAGDVVVLTLPDAAVDAATDRPRVRLDGRARVAILAGDGTVQLDGDAAGAVPVPAGAALIAVQAGTTAGGAGQHGAATTDGLAGWHVRSRVCALGSHAALAPGCVITAEGVPTVRGVMWTSPGELFGSAAAVSTRFARPVRTVAVVVEAARAERLDEMALELTGAVRAVGPDRRPRPPVVVLGGGQATLVFAIEPLRFAPDGPDGGAVTVRVRAGGERRLTGVLAGDLSPDEVADLVARGGVVAATGRLDAVTGDGCAVSWEVPDGRR